MRQRTDGTWTNTTPEWDQAWYWPVGTRVSVRPECFARSVRPTADEVGTVTQANTVSVRVKWDSGRTTGLVPVDMLRRVQ
jgi:hypothetical protein